MVTSPAVPPYSSATTAMWTRCDAASEEIVEPLRFGNDVGRAKSCLMGSVGRSDHERQEILGVEDPHDLIDRLAEHRQASGPSP